jgi:cytoskeletal protein RodZ
MGENLLRQSCNDERRAYKMDQYRETLGQYLKRKRESHHLSVQEMALSAGVKTSFIKAIEDNDFDVFKQYSQVAWLVKRYAIYMNLNQAGVLRRLEVQWELYGGATKRYLQLSLFPEDDPSFSKTGGGKVRRLFGRYLNVGAPQAFIVLIFMVVFFLLAYLPNSEKETKTDDSRFSKTDKKVGSAGSPVPSFLSNVGKSDTLPKRVPDAGENPSRSAQNKVSLPQNDVKVVGNSDSKRYHLPGMKYYHQVKEYHRVTFPSENDAIKAGYHKARE